MKGTLADDNSYILTGKPIIFYNIYGGTQLIFMICCIGAGLLNTITLNSTRIHYDVPPCSLVFTITARYAAAAPWFVP